MSPSGVQGQSLSGGLGAPEARRTLRYQAEETFTERKKSIQTDIV